MARQATRLIAGFPWRPLAQPLGASERERLAARLRALLRWQRGLARWPRVDGKLPDATPFVALYAASRLAGCFGSDEGAPGERLARAFLRALEDGRFGRVLSTERPDLVAQLSYPIGPRRTTPDRVLGELEIGSHGIALACPGREPVVLLPQVARDASFGALELLQAASRKAGLEPDGWRTATLTVFETEDIVVRARPSRRASAAPIATARAWLASLVAPDGAVTFAVDARRRLRRDVGPMHHGRASVLVAALAGYESPAVARAKARLTRDITLALAGHDVAGWPKEPAVVAGTCALACLAGAPLEKELVALAEQRPELLENTWHAAQVALALGARTPKALWRACVTGLERRPWAPWTVLAARQRKDSATTARGEAALIDSLRTTGPHVGGAHVTPVPELALTAIAVEALAESSASAARRAAERGREFLLRWQLVGEHVPAILDPDLVTGAFPVSPVVDLARADVTAHALMALDKPALTRR